MNMTIVRPNRAVAGLVLLGAAILYAGISQNNNAAFLFGFLVASVAGVSAARTWFNLRCVSVRIERPRPAFAGQEAVLRMEIGNRMRRTARALALTLENQGKSGEQLVEEVGGGDTARATLRFGVEKRGLQPVPGVIVSTQFPLGFFTARIRVRSDEQILVYPRPDGNPEFPTASARASGSSAQPQHREGDDFAGLREYVTGESQRHIDWKAVARGLPRMIKQFAGETSERLMFGWDQVVSLPYERRLSQLALWVVKAERSGRLYGLHLPGQVIELGRGDAHFHQCLRALAMMPQEGAR